MNLSELISLTRRTVGDILHEGNTTGWTDPEVTVALNWAQDRYCELTRCTSMETSVQAGTDGRVSLPENVLEALGLRSPEITALPDATITAPLSVDRQAAFTASVADQPGASIFWSVAGGRLESGQGTAQASLHAPSERGWMTVQVHVWLNGFGHAQMQDIQVR